MSLEANKATPDPGVRQQIFEQIHQLYLTELPLHHALQPDRSLNRTQRDA